MTRDEAAPLNLLELEERARAALDPMAFDYYAGGAHDELTLGRNRAAYEQMALVPRVLVDVSTVDTGVELLGRRHPMPVVIAPMAFQRLAHADGELGVARAAAGSGVTMTLSTLSTTSIEDVAAAGSPAAPPWFQLYVFRDRGLTRELVARAEAAGYEALVLTVDAPRLGNRERDARRGFHLPAGLLAANLIAAAEQERARLEPTGVGSSLAAYFERNLDPTLTWRDLEWLAGETRLPVLVKGVLDPRDGRLAVERGIAGVVVSNHGGRQLDTAPATIEALPAVAEAVYRAGDGRAVVLVDGGIRRGTDVLKALASGAHAVMLGRPVLWALAAGAGGGGEEGVRHALGLLAAEVELAMMLAGAPDVASLTPELLA